MKSGKTSDTKGGYLLVGQFISETRAVANRGYEVNQIRAEWATDVQSP